MIKIVFKSISFFIFICLTSCNSSRTSFTLSLPERYEGASTVRLDEYSIKEEISRILHVFSDTIQKEELDQLWNYLKYREQGQHFSSATANRDNLISFRRILNDRGFQILKPTPVTFETLFAFSRLPIVTYLVTSTLNNSHKEHNSVKDINQLPRDIDSTLNISMLRSISRSETGISATTTGHLKISGKAKDILNGHISLKEDGQLLKCFDILLVSKLPSNEIKEYINEWHKNLSYEYEKPEILDLKQE